jgi:hypothetical protein
MRDIAVEEPIERGISLHAGFGYDNQISGVFLALRDRSKDAGSIAFVVSVGSVYLPDRDAHLFDLILILDFGTCKSARSSLRYDHRLLSRNPPGCVVASNLKPPIPGDPHCLTYRTFGNTKFEPFPDSPKWSSAI